MPRSRGRSSPRPRTIPTTSIRNTSAPASAGTIPGSTEWSWPTVAPARPSKLADARSSTRRREGTWRFSSAATTRLSSHRRESPAYCRRLRRRGEPPSNLAFPWWSAPIASPRVWTRRWLPFSIKSCLGPNTRSSSSTTALRIPPRTWSPSTRLRGTCWRRTSVSHSPGMPESRRHAPKSWLSSTMTPKRILAGWMACSASTTAIPALGRWEARSSPSGMPSGLPG
ncbi:hypothetical protein D3C87_1517280 [compost metagenome]